MCYEYQSNTILWQTFEKQEMRIENWWVPFFQTSYGLRWMSAEEREVNKQTISAVTLRSEESQYLEENAFAFNRMIVGSYEI